MGQGVIQTSWNAGEWAPALNARVDMAKYHSGAALLRNFFVDYRGGATTRPGSKYILPAKTNGARLIPFQASFAVSYILEFGNSYVRFYNNGAPILETATSITAAASGPPEVFTDAAHGYANGDWIFANNTYYIIANVTANTFTLTDLFGNAINTNPFTLPINAQRIYTISSPYVTSELFDLKYVQDVNSLIINHPNHPPYILTLVTATNWTLGAITFGSTIPAPTGQSVSTSLAAGTVNYAYVITAVDTNGQESAPSAFATALSLQDIRSVGGTNTVSWTTVTKAVSYNVYRAVPSYGAPVPGGSQFGFIGNCTGTSFIDSNITPDFSQTPPVVQNPFAGTGVQSINMTNDGDCTGFPVPTVQFSGGGGSGATAIAFAGLRSATIAAGGNGYVVGNRIPIFFGIVIGVTSVGPGGAITGISIINRGSISTGTTTPTSAGPVGGIPGGGVNAVFDLFWAVISASVTSPGTGYTSAPSVGFPGNSSTATCTIGTASSGNPTAPGFIQQRLVFGGPVLSPSQINLSQPGSPFNFNISDPTQPDDAIQETLTNTTLNAIKSFTSVAAGLLVLTDKGAWVINGGSFGAGISALSIVANPQTYSGSNDLPPIVAPNDILYMKSQGSVVVDLTYNFYLSNYTGTDISILSSHLFYGFTFPQWTWAEEPFKLAWLVRSDGLLLSLSFVKEQELIAWAHHDTLGAYTSIASVIEDTSISNVSAVYVIAQRNIQGQTVQYIERFVELTYPNDYKSSWQVDAGIGYNAAPATTFTGAQHLGGQAVTGVADGTVINFTMPTSGTFIFGPGGTPGLTGIASASIVTVGLAFLPQIQTLRLDLGEPTVQGKRKKISAVTTRCNQTLGLSIGATFTTLTPMKDLIIGNVGTMSNQLVTGLVTDDARTIIDPNWTVPGQFCIQQNNPYPASVLGIIPEIDVGDTPK